MVGDILAATISILERIVRQQHSRTVRDQDLSAWRATRIRDRKANGQAFGAELDLLLLRPAIR